MPMIAASRAGTRRDACAGRAYFTTASPSSACALRSRQIHGLESGLHQKRPGMVEYDVECSVWGTRQCPWNLLVLKILCIKYIAHCSFNGFKLGLSFYWATIEKYWNFPLAATHDPITPLSVFIFFFLCLCFYCILHNFNHRRLHTTVYAFVTLCVPHSVWKSGSI